MPKIDFRFLANMNDQIKTVCEQLEADEHLKNVRLQ